MRSTVVLFDREIPLYGIMFYVGIALAAVAATLILRRRKTVPPYDLVYSAVYTLIGAVVGAKLLFVLVSLKTIIEMSLPWYSFIKGGFVFYGGFIGGALGLFIYAKQFKMRFEDFVDIYAAVIPLGHSIGRLGCYFAGCCYGMPYDGFGAVTYHSTPGNTPLNTPLFPIQLTESMILFVLFIVLTVICLKTTRRGTVAVIYVASYAVIRFVLEFFRGDGIRGIWLGLSTGQWISIGMAVSLVMFTLIRQMGHNIKQ